MNTKINVQSFAKQLRAKLEALKKERAAALKKYDAEFEKWKKELHSWVDRNAYEKIHAITKTAVRNHRGYSRGPDFSAETFFIGCPKPPKYPSDEQIRKIQNMLRHLGITGQKTITLSTSEVGEFLGDKGDADISYEN
jgi:hypothetical protein